MNARARRKKRRDTIISVCSELREDSLDGHGLSFEHYEESNLYETIKDLTGFDFLSDPEQRLAVVAFEQGAGIAKQSVWYK